MGATNSVAGLCTVVQNLTPMHFGGASTKLRKRYVISFVDATNGIAVGGTTNKLNVADLGVGMKIIDSCSNLAVLTTSSGAVVKIVPAVPSADGTFIVLADAANATAANHEGPADVAISSTQTGQITVDGF